MLIFLVLIQDKRVGDMFNDKGRVLIRDREVVRQGGSQGVEESYNDNSNKYFGRWERGVGYGTRRDGSHHRETLRSGNRRPLRLTYPCYMCSLWTPRSHTKHEDPLSEKRTSSPPSKKKQGTCGQDSVYKPNINGCRYIETKKDVQGDPHPGTVYREY